MSLNRAIFPIFLLIVAAFISACASSAPFQELSNARQTIQAAREAGAERYATELLGVSERLLDKAASKMQAGEYDVARGFAIEAQQQALQARNQAIKKKSELK